MRGGPRAEPQSEAWMDVSSSPEEAFASRWVIVTNMRMLHVQEEPGWGLDRDKVKALDLTR